jgi:hypothetical protein
MQPGIYIEVIWLDEDMLEIRVRASNARFGGQVEVYTSLDFAAELARDLRGFPNGERDVREWLVGKVDPPSGAGGLRLAFRCSDAAGHLVVDVALDSGSQLEPRGTASFAFGSEPAVLDRFVDALARMPVERSAAVFLPACVG